jgi:hypothetical protein
MSNTNTANDIQAASELPKLRTLNITNSQVEAIQYGNAAIPTYNGNKIFDVSQLIDLQFSVQNAKGVHYFKFNNNKEHPFNVGSAFFVGCSNLKRVFGHISLNGNGVFNQCSKFYIHEPKEKVEGITPDYNGEWFGPDTNTEQGSVDWRNNTNLSTNFSIGTTDGNVMFRGTNCSIYDVYYFLYKCDNVTTLSSCFASVTNIKWDLLDSPRRTMFNHCTKVVDMSSIFQGLPTQNFKIFTSTYENGSTEHNGLFSPLISLKFIDNAFNFGGTKYTDSTFLGKFKGNVDSKLIRLNNIISNIKFVNNINSSPNDETIANNLLAANSGNLLVRLPELEYITNMFNRSNIYFNQTTDEDVEDGVMYCPLFYKNTKLKYIQDSFKELIKSNGSLYNIFGGTVKNKVNLRFPTALYGIYNSFSIGDNSTITFPIHNSMFSRLKNSLKYITGQQAINQSTLGCFKGFTKEFIKEEDEVFPYDVFTNCSAIVEIPGFFSKLILPANSVIELPLNSFKTNYNLTNISYLYYDMKNCKYSLTGKGFSNCKLVNVHRCFSEIETSFVKKGFIPYGLFYMEQTSNVSYKGWNEVDAASQNITENYGIDSDGNWIENAEMPVEITYSKQRTLPRKTIVNMSYCLERFQSTEAQGYTMNYGNLTPSNYGDIIVPNEKYNPVKYILNPNYDPREWLDDEHTMPNYNRDIHRVILNKDFDKYELAWNEYCVDGLSGLEDIVRDSALYSAISTGSINCSPVIPNRFKDNAGSFAPPSGANANKKVLNYICSPDLFYYCTNGNNMQVNGVFFGSGRVNGIVGYNYLDYGLRGRIPPHLFYPISNATDLSYTFYRMPLLNPYKWNVSNGEDGEFYSADTFSKLTKLISLSNMFYFCIISAHINLPIDSFVNCIQLQDISSMFLAAQFESTSEMGQQVDGNLFNKNVNLRNISYAFASGQTVGDCSDRSPKKINSTLFNVDKHKRLTNVTGLFYNAVSTVGSVPEFWNWLNTLSASNRANVFYKMKKSNISNSASIPTDWANGMTD